MAKPHLLDREPPPLRTTDQVAQTLQVCLRSRWDRSALSEPGVLLPAGDSKWMELAERSVQQQVAGLIFRPVKSLGEQVPPTAVRRLEAAYYLYAAQNTLLFEELSRVLARLATAGIRTLALKGLALAETLYKDVSVRPMSDADLLLDHNDLPVALGVLADMGYSPSQKEARPGIVAEFENELVVSRAESTLPRIELHWHLIDSPFYQRSLSTQWIWNTAQSARVAGQRTLVLGLEAEVLYLCAHMLLHHGAPSLLWLHDLAELLARRGSQIDWEEVLARAQQFQLVLPLQRTLPVLAEHWRLHQPSPALLDRLLCLAPSKEEQRAFDWLSSSKRTVAQRFFADLASLSQGRARLRYALAHLFPQPAYMRERYHIPHPALLPAYYAYRWVLGLISICRTLAGAK